MAGREKEEARRIWAAIQKSAIEDGALHDGWRWETFADFWQSYSMDYERKVDRLSQLNNLLSEYTEDQRKLGLASVVEECEQVGVYVSEDLRDTLREQQEISACER